MFKIADILNNKLSRKFSNTKILITNTPNQKIIGVSLIYDFSNKKTLHITWKEPRCTSMCGDNLLDNSKCNYITYYYTDADRLDMYEALTIDNENYTYIGRRKVMLKGKPCDFEETKVVKNNMLHINSGLYSVFDGETNKISFYEYRWRQP